ncbi:hypothetical protein BDZ94DRAFT_284957 [Collybia nuda]|uniref:N-acetyltransferase domain-containing protein n=1 Tax=Collybia nuda TaxID=64659 RepID=A0A9P5YE64_9AGAR|nr:hypothetical protein BDZ94DRAFT_284957 [Collybia nuda]
MVFTSIQRIEDVNDKIIDKAADLFYDLMKDELAGISLCGEFYTATEPGSGALVGYAIWMPTGHELLESEAQRKLGFDDFSHRLSDAGKAFFKDTVFYLKYFPDFVNGCLGPTGRRDSWWLHQIMVRTENQRQGVATSLINVVKEKAGKNHQQLALSVTQEANVPVYTNQGFVIRGRSELKSPWVQII